MRPTAALLLFIAAVLCPGAGASPVTYAVTVDTSSLGGTTGSLDFNFNPGPLGSQAASVVLFGLTGGTPSGPAQAAGDVSGALPGTVMLDNGTALNDSFQPYIFGNTLTFDISFDGPALTAPDGISLSGSAFAFSIFSDPAGTLPALTTDTLDGFAITVLVNLDGSTTLNNYTAGSVSVLGQPGNVTPEPAAWYLLGTGLLLGSCRRKASRRRSGCTPAPLLS